MSRIVMIAAAAAVLASPLAAQGKKSVGIPPGHIPPAGMCRIWIDGVPPGQQAAPIDCATAERSARPANSRLIYGVSKNAGAWERGLVVTNDRDAQGRVIYRDANGRFVTRETTSDGRIVWRDLNGNLVYGDREKVRRADKGDDDDKLTKEQKERRKAEKAQLKAEKERLKAERRAQEKLAKEQAKLAKEAKKPLR